MVSTAAFGTASTRSAFRHAGFMRAEVEALLDSYGGVVTRHQLTRTLPVHVIDDALASRVLVRIFPSTYTTPDLLTEPSVRHRGAVRYAGGNAALSHLSGLWGWALPVPTPYVVHITVHRRCQLRHASGLVVHHRAGFRAEPPYAVMRDGLLVVRLERCLVDSWPLLPAAERRAPVIFAVQGRRTTAARIAAEVGQAPKLPGRAELAALLHLLELGCHSELEIWGHRHVFNHSSLPHARRQRPVELGIRTVYLDLAYEEEMVAVELDGSAYHGDRDRDQRRDLALEAQGWLTLRFSHRRLHAEVESVRQELRATLVTRRRQLAGRRTA